MESDYFQKIYDNHFFDGEGRAVIAQLTEHLEYNIHNTSKKTIAWKSPEEELNFWRHYFESGRNKDFFEETLRRTTHIHNPKYVGHQVAAPAPITALTALVGALLNNGGAVFEMGMATNAMERIVTDVLCEKMGWEADARGILTSGGTLANLTALLSARRAKIDEDIWNDGLTKPLGVMVCEEAHYCIERAAKIMGLGEKGIVKIPASHNFAMDVTQLEAAYAQATKEGITIFAIVGSAPSTATGAYDNLEAIGAFANNYNLWFHVDGAHGGAAIFSRKYRHLLNGIENADSVVIDGHKMMLMPTITTALLYRNGNDSYATFSQTADYLLTEVDEEDWYNLGKRTFECTKTMMSMHWFVLLKFYGEELFDKFVTRQYDLAKDFELLLEQQQDFEIAVSPASNIICFRFVKPELNRGELNHLNGQIREQLLSQGEFYLVQTKLRGSLFLRTTLMSPFTEKQHLRHLLQTIRATAHSIN
ncbi:MAG: aminotransferase class I/II-fold pyridoxal phosphate-dependent enzyme [Allomuricauda sp.]|nr:MAG: aminotransferase class I/II-fold pyridoxal phosphate-dependent enzyme [Allomuricauda sp.]